MAWLVSHSGPLTAEGKAAMNHALDILDDWCARNTAIPAGRENHGIGLFQQIEDSSLYLLTTRWESVEQHQTWISSPENQTVYPALKDYFQLEKTILFHVEDVEMFKTPDSNGAASLLESPVVSVSRLVIAAEKREAFDQSWKEVKGILEEFAKPNAVKSGWRIEKDDPAVGEYILACGWPGVERHWEFAIAKDFHKFAAVPQSFATARDVKHYQRIL